MGQGTVVFLNVEKHARYTGISPAFVTLIKTQMTYIYFDLGNVLVHFDPQRACQNVASLLGVDAEAVHAAMYTSGLEDRYERGELSDVAFTNELCQSLGATADSVSLLDAMADMFVPHDEMLPVIKYLQSQGMPLGILSNTCAAHWSWVQRQRWEVSSGWFRDAILSYEVGAMKPDPRIYQCAAQRAGVGHDRIFFTDDRAENIAAARELGWHAVLFTDPQNLLHDIANFRLSTAS